MQNLATATTERKNQAASALAATDAEIATLEALPTLSPAQQQQLALLHAQRHTGAGVVAACDHDAALLKDELAALQDHQKMAKDAKGLVATGSFHQ